MTNNEIHAEYSKTWVKHEQAIKEFDYWDAKYKIANKCGQTFAACIYLNNMDAALKNARAYSNYAKHLVNTYGSIAYFGK